MNFVLLFSFDDIYIAALLLLVQNKMEIQGKENRGIVRFT
jgi:hypothetical protein